MLKAAYRFHDYNFRTYFVEHIQEDTLKLGRLSPLEQKNFLAGEGKQRLQQMQRMCLVSKLYAMENARLSSKDLNASKESE